MSGLRVLMVSGSAGLGHVTRDLAIAHQLRALKSEAEIHWLAGGPALRVLEAAGQHVVSEAADYADLTRLAETVHGTVLDYAEAIHRDEARNAELTVRVATAGGYDVVVGDEVYYLCDRLAKHPDERRWPFVMLIDFFAADVVKHTVREHLIALDFNWSWLRWDRRLFRDPRNRCLFVGELADVADRGVIAGLPRRRRHARRYFDFVGPVLAFDPTEWSDPKRVRASMGYDDCPLVIATIGGTAVGRRLLGLFQAAHPLIRRELPQARMVLVCGPNIDPASLTLGDGVEARGYVPDLYRHLAACDVAITQGGGTTTMELTALRRPFVYFPLEGHFEQEGSVASRLERQGAGVRMAPSRTTPETLAAAVVAQFGKPVAYPPIRTDGAKLAAAEILSLVE